jgi:hypothetical protein
MKIRIACLLVAGAALAAEGSCAPAVKKSSPHETAQETQGRRALAEKVAAGWADNGRLAALALIEKYGPPDEVHSAHLVWTNRGPWRTTVVRDLPPPYAGAKTAELGVVEQTVEYPLRPDQADVLAAFGRTLKANTLTGEITARSDNENINFLRVNLADEMLNGRLTVDQAREAYERILALESAGKTTGYLGGLRFAPELKRP